MNRIISTTLFKGKMFNFIVVEKWLNKGEKKEIK